MRTLVWYWAFLIVSRLQGLASCVDIDIIKTFLIYQTCKQTYFCTYIYLELSCASQNHNVFSIRLVWFVNSDWVLSDTKILFGVTICLNQLNIAGVLYFLCKVIGYLGFLNYNQIYLLRINKTYSPLYNTYQFLTASMKFKKMLRNREDDLKKQ